MLWYENPPQINVVHVYCPVVPTIKLGIKKKGEIKSFHCDDCKAMHWFYPGEKKKPISVLDSHKDKGCNCWTCRR